MNRELTTLLIACLVGMVLTACGGAETEPGPIATPSSTPSIAASPTSTLTAVCATAMAAPTVDPAQAARAGSARATSAALLVAATATACAVPTQR